MVAFYSCCQKPVKLTFRALALRKGESNVLNSPAVNILF